MKYLFTLLQGILLLGILAEGAYLQDIQSLSKQNEVLFRQLQQIHNLTEEQMSLVRAIFTRSGYIGQGNPAITIHPVTVEQCKERLKREGKRYENPTFEKICGAKYMAPLYNPAVERPEDACVCIDQFEFPNIPCAYPVVWVRAKEAVEICEAMGKRLCDAHEWEGACAGALIWPDYRFDLAAGRSPKNAIHLMREAHNRKYSPKKSWSYGPEYRAGVCGSSSRKSSG
ncbi:MAG: hypothetical protein SV062_13425 [Thermodesulfobacteriota bacterium]|nr:hypothetical protein [Thermodesulfobacteriota bacterium]